MSQNKSTLQILVEPVDIECTLGDSVNLSAVVKSPNPSFQWYNENGKRIPMQTNCNLTFRSLRKGDFGFYRLIIGDSTTREEKWTRWIEIRNKNAIGTETMDAAFTTYFLPILVSSSQGGSYRMGSAFTLTAHFRNATAYQWYKDGYKLEGYVGNVLVIRNADVSISGTYVLAAVNGNNREEIQQTQPIPVNIF